MKIIKVSTVPESLYQHLKGQLKFLSQHFDIVAVSSSGNYLEEVNKREGVRVIAVDMKRNISPLNDLISLVRLYIAFRREKPHIVHSMTPKAGLLSMLAAKMAGVPIRMHTFTGLIFPSREGAMQKLLIQLDRLLCWCATHIYPEGNGVKSDLIAYKITRKPLNVIANGNVNGIDLTYFNPSLFDSKFKLNFGKNLGLNEDDFVCVFVGRLVKDKGVNELVEAFLGIKNNNIKLLLVGSFETDLDPLKENTINTINTHPNIISVGFQKDIRPYLAISNLLVFPSYREGFPNVVMQAGAMGLPCVVSNINGCNEIIVDGQNGVIIPVKNSQVIADEIEKLYNDKDLFHNLCANSRGMILSRYDQKVVWDALLYEYNENTSQLF